MKILKKLFVKDGDDIAELRVGGNTVPVGTVIYTAGAVPPRGFLICNGAEVVRTTYPDLFRVIGETYGAGDGSTTFNLPNLLGKFAEGSLTPGEVKAPGLPNITGSLGTHWYTLSRADGAMQVTESTSGKVFSRPGVMDVDGYCVTTFDASRSSSIYGASNTVQPAALTLLPCIKAFDVVTNLADVDTAAFMSETNAKFANRTVVVASWRDGRDWWVEYSNGLLEQGSFYYGNTAAGWGTVQINFVRPFAEPPNVLLSPGMSVESFTSTSAPLVCTVADSTATTYGTALGFTMGRYYSKYWRAVGYKGD